MPNLSSTIDLEDDSTTAGFARTGASSEWLEEFEILAAFHGAVFGIVGWFVAALTCDGMLLLAASVGTALCASLWVHRLNGDVSN